MPASAPASPQQETLLIDDAQFVYGDAQQVDQRMADAQALGFNRVRVSVYWRLLAPSPDKEEKPAGDASDPRWYGPGQWDRYDRIVQLAAAHGLGVLFTITGPSPLWATGTPEQGRSDVADTWDPSAKDFGEFVSAVAKRYSGSWRDEHEEPSALPLLPPTKTMGPPLPRVDHWSVRRRSGAAARRRSTRQRLLRRTRRCLRRAAGRITRTRSGRRRASVTGTVTT